MTRAAYVSYAVALGAVLLFGITTFLLPPFVLGYRPPPPPLDAMVTFLARVWLAGQGIFALVLIGLAQGALLQMGAPLPRRAQAGVLALALAGVVLLGLSYQDLGRAYGGWTLLTASGLVFVGTVAREILREPEETR